MEVIVRAEPTHKTGKNIFFNEFFDRFCINFNPFFAWYYVQLYMNLYCLHTTCSYSAYGWFGLGEEVGRE